MRSSSSRPRLSKALYWILWASVLGVKAVPKSVLQKLTPDDIDFLEGFFSSGKVVFYREKNGSRRRLKPPSVRGFIKSSKYKPSDMMHLNVSLGELDVMGLLSKKEIRGGYKYWLLGHLIIDPIRYANLYLSDKETARTLFKVLGIEEVYDKYGVVVKEGTDPYSPTPQRYLLYIDGEVGGRRVTVDIILDNARRRVILQAFAEGGGAVYLDRFSSDDVEKAKIEAARLAAVAEEYAELVDSYMDELRRHEFFGSRILDQAPSSTAVAWNYSIRDIIANKHVFIELSPYEALTVSVVLRHSKTAPNGFDHSEVVVSYSLYLRELKILQNTIVDAVSELVDKLFVGDADVSMTNGILSITVRHRFRGDGAPTIVQLCEKVLALKGAILGTAEELITRDAEFLKKIDFYETTYGEMIRKLKWEDKQSEEEKLFALLAFKLAYGPTNTYAILKNVMQCMVGDKADKYLKDPVATLVRLMKNGKLEISAEGGRPVVRVYGKRIDELVSSELAEKVANVIAGLFALLGYSGHRVGVLTRAEKTGR